MKGLRAAVLYNVYTELIDLMKYLENGTEDPNKVAERLGADPNYKEE